jgi:hypothetical protein
MCVQRFDDSLNSAIHTTYRISLRSSSMPEPRDPLLKVLMFRFFRMFILRLQKVFWGSPLAGGAAEETDGAQKKARVMCVSDFSETPVLAGIPYWDLLTSRAFGAPR